MSDYLQQLFSVEGKTALVTGGSRGIGRMIAEGFVRGGATVMISARSQADCAETAKALSEHGECRAMPADLSTEEGIDQLKRAVEDRCGRLDILVNNAGATWGAPIDEFPARGWDKVFDLNVRSVFFLTQALLPLLRAAASEADPARVINIGSVDGVRTPPFDSWSYSASKAALHQLTKLLATKLADGHITANTIAPGPFESKMMAPMMDRFGKEIADSVPLKRFGRPDEMAGLALFLASRAGGYMNGALVPLDGGILGAAH